MKNISLIEKSGFKRYEIEDFVASMKRKLVMNMKKGRSWYEAPTNHFLKGKLMEEVGEYFKSSNPDELIDIANICLMLYERRDKDI